MKRFAIFLPLISSGVFANGTAPPPDPTPVLPAEVASESQASAAADAKAEAESTAASSATANAEGGNSDSRSNANSGGNSLSISNVYKQRKQAPAVLTAATNTTAKCSQEWHAGASVAGGGLGFGKSYTSRDCVLAEAAAEELARGNLSASILLRCGISFYQKLLGEDCPALLNTQTVSKEYASKEYVDRAFKKAMEK